ncbi:MAG: class I SAM-dependent RNA methyltransferase [Lentisphaerae bacterium]|nr:class I SAM-dependent RNA methyltransferase [Lentisphaerota bacterium]
MQRGDLVELTIDDVGFGGAGVGRVDGMAVFVPFTIDGERVRARVVKTARRYAAAEPVAVEVASPMRVTPPCPAFGRCGGCQLQHIAYPRQLALKKRALGEIMRRIGGVADAPAADLPPAPRPYGYRNRITLHGRGPYGFVGTDNRSIVPVTRCEIAAEGINRRLAAPGAGAAETRGDLVLRCDGHGNVWSYGTRDRARAVIEERVLDKRLRVPLNAFFQVNVPVAEQIAAALDAALAASECSVLADAYCGAGLFTLLLAGRVERAIGIERSPEAVRAAQANARALKLPHCRFRAAPAEQALGPALAPLPMERTCLLLDPPRAGCGDKVLAAIASSRPRMLIYLSCNPPVLARDARRLTETGYRLRNLLPFDMFPQTAHFEAVALLETN